MKKLCFGRVEKEAKMLKTRFGHVEKRAKMLKTRFGHVGKQSKMLKMRFGHCTKSLFINILIKIQVIFRSFYLKIWK